MAKLIFHADTGTYFSADDGVYVIDTDLVPAELLEAFYNEAAELLDHPATRAAYESMFVPIEDYVFERIYASETMRGGE